MIYFVRMPSQSILIGECLDVQELFRILTELREKYEPHFPTRIGEISNLDYRNTCKKLSDYRIPKTSQFKPSPYLIDFINENHDHHPQFRQLSHVDKWESVVESTHKENFVKIDLGVSLEKEMMVEGMMSGVNSMDIIRNNVRLCQAVRRAVRSGSDVDGAVSNLVAYLTRKSRDI